MREQATNVVEHPQAPAKRMATVNAMPGLSHAEARVLSALAYYDMPKGCYPTVATIAALAGGMADKTVREHIKAMVRKGALAKRKGRHGDHYSINYSWCGDRRATRQSENLRRGRQTGGTPGARPAGHPPMKGNGGGNLSAPTAQREIPTESDTASAPARPAPPEGADRSGAFEDERPPDRPPTHECPECGHAVRIVNAAPRWRPCEACGAAEVWFQKCSAG